MTRPIGAGALGAQWDERRNTSRQFGPEPGAADAAIRACASLRQSDPELVRWIEDGHPTLTDAEHHARFRCAYTRGKR